MSKRLFSALCLLICSQFIHTKERSDNNVPYQIATGALHSCTIDDEGVKCWGANHHGQIEVPKLANPRQISASFLHTCAIDDTGIVCWGWNRYKQLENIPTVKDPKEISVGLYSSCVIDQGQVICWGAQNVRRVKILVAYKDKWDPVKPYPIPDVTNPHSLSLGANHGCVIDENRVRCWGANNHGQIEVPPLINPSKVDAQEDRSCALDDTGVVCWGLDTLRLGNKAVFKNVNTPPHLENPYDLAVGGTDTCVLESRGTKCWGHHLEYMRKTPVLEKAFQLRISGNNGCALTIEGIRCWGYNKEGQTVPPRLVFDEDKLMEQYLRQTDPLPDLEADWRSIQQIKMKQKLGQEALVEFRQFRVATDLSYSPPSPSVNLNRQPFETTSEFQERLVVFQNQLGQPERLVIFQTPTYEAGSSEWFINIPDTLLINSKESSTKQYESRNAEGASFTVNKKTLLEEEFVLTNAKEIRSNGSLNATSRFVMDPALARIAESHLVYVLLLEHQREDPSHFFEEPIAIFPSFNNPNYVTGTKRLIKVRIEGLALVDIRDGDKILKMNVALSNDQLSLLQRETEISEKIDLFQSTLKTQEP